MWHQRAQKRGLPMRVHAFVRVRVRMCVSIGGQGWLL